MPRLLPASARSPKPWKNGGGITTDVLVLPEGAGLDDFEARVSIAEVEQDGPFSIFAGIDRTTAILAGGGFDLTFTGGRTHRLTRQTQPLSYSGDTPATSRLIAGTTTDLNAMTRRGRATHRMTPVILAPGSFWTVDRPALLFVTGGPLQLETGGQILGLSDRDAVFVRTAARIKILGPAPAAGFEITFGDSARA